MQSAQVEALPILQREKNRKGKFSFANIGAERLSGLFFASGQIQAIVIDLVSGANLQTEILQRPDDAWIRFADEGPQLAGDTKRARLSSSR